MNRSGFILILLLALAGIGPAASAYPGVAEYEFGKSRKDLIEKESEIRAAAGNPEARRKAAREMTSILTSAATLEARRFACRQLSLIGEEQEVPALADLLADKDLSDMARFALERNPAPEARAALRAALQSLKGEMLVGTINALGRVRDSGAIDALAEILSGSDEDARGAAAAALGRIGGDRALAALETARTQASPELLAVIDDACLACAGHFLARGDRKCLEIYQGIFDRPGPRPVRAAALRGLAAIKGPDALPLILDNLKGEVSGLGTDALRCLTEMDLTGQEKPLEKALAGLEPATRSLYLGALAGRDDSAGAAAALAAAEDESEEVRKAALHALGILGDDASVPVLAEAATRGEGDEREAARASLDRLRGKGVNAAMLDRLSSGREAVKKELIRSLAARNAVEALPALIKALAGPGEDIQAESARALGELGLMKSLNPLIATLLETQSDKVRSAVREALDGLCRKEGSGADCTDALIAALDRAGVPARCEILATLPAAGEKAGLAVIRLHLTDGSTLVRESAVRALGKWPDPEPAEDLLAIASDDPSEKLKIIALRGYIRLAGLAGNRPDAQIAKMYSKAFATATRPDEGRLVLAALGERPKPFALELSLPRLQDPELKSEAVAAIEAVSRKLQYSDPEPCEKALKRAVKACGDKEKKNELRAFLKSFKERSKYVALWRICGPYQEPDVDNKQLLAHEFGPEKGDEADWWDYFPYPEAEKPWRVDLAEEIGDEDAVAYLKTRIFTPKARRARLELGSDDGVKAWLNGRMIHENNATRSLIDRQDRIKIDLREGWNELLLKVSQSDGEWGVSARLCRSLGRRLPGIRIDPTPEENRE